MTNKISPCQFFLISVLFLSLYFPLVSQAQISEIPKDFQFEKSLYLGLQSNDVKYLQIVLKELGPEIYLEGSTTGYYGSLTVKAVTNFQLEHSVISSASDPSAGYVGPLTRKKLNETLVGLIKTPEETADQSAVPETQTLQIDRTVEGNLTVAENIKTSRLYQEKGNLIINTLGSGNLMLNAATGLHLYGGQVIIDSTNLLNPLVYIESPLRVKGALAQTDGNVTFGGDVSAGTLDVSTLTASGLTVSGTATLSALTVSSVNSNGKLIIVDTSTPQLTVKYDASNYLDISIGSDGNVTFNATGTLPKFTFEDDVEISGNATTTGDFTVSGDLKAQTHGTATYVVAASTTPDHIKAQADYICDGTDDQVEIQAAIDAANAAGGGRVFLAATSGYYDVAAHIIPKSNVIISGEGAASELRLHDNTADNVFEFAVGTTSDVVFENFAIDGNRTNNMGEDDEHVLYKGIFCTPSASYILNRITLRGMTIHDCKTGVLLAPNPGKDLHVTDSNFYNNENTSIEYIYADSGVVSGNTIKDKDVYDNDVHEQIEIQLSSGVSVTGNSIIGSGILTFNSSKNSFVGNTITFPDATHDWVGFRFSQSGGTYNENNVYTGNTVIGLSTSYGYGVKMDDETVGGSRYNLFEANQFIGMKRGVYILDADNGYNYFVSNTLKGNGATAWLNYNNDYSHFINNRIISTEGDGFSFTAGDLSHCIFERNVIRGQTGNAIKVEAGVTTHPIAYNTIIGTIAQTAKLNYKTSQVVDSFLDVKATSTTFIRSNEDLSAALPITFTLDAQPDVPRNLVWSFDSHAQITAFSITITGTNASGASITSTITQANGWSGTLSQGFATITSIQMTSRTGTGAGDTMDIGIGSKLGLSNDFLATTYNFGSASSIYKVQKNGADYPAASWTEGATYNTVDVSTGGVMVEGDDFTVWYIVNTNNISAE